MRLQESGEMYLETIYVLSKSKSVVRSIDVVEHLGYSKPSVSRAMNILKKDGYITIDTDGGISLTEEGEAMHSRAMHIPTSVGAFNPLTVDETITLYQLLYKMLAASPLLERTELEG